MNTPLDRYRAAIERLPLVAILRGLTPEEAPAVGDAIVEAGFGLLEVPLNSPRPLESIALLRARFPDYVPMYLMAAQVSQQLKSTLSSLYGVVEVETV